MDLEQFKNNSKTSYLYEMYQKLIKDEAELLAMIENNPELADMSQDDLKNITLQKEELVAQMQNILAEEEKEEEFPNEIILEVRAGAGGEEAALFAQELAVMYTTYARNQG